MTHQNDAAWRTAKAQGALALNHHAVAFSPPINATPVPRFCHELVSSAPGAIGTRDVRGWSRCADAAGKTATTGLSEAPRPSLDPFYALSYPTVDLGAVTYVTSRVVMLAI